MTLIADTLDEDAGRTAVSDLRAARRRNRLAHLDWFDAFYKAYVTALFATIGVYVASGAFGDEPLTHSAIRTIETTGPAYLGIIVAFTVAVGLRSGGRGGPLAFERADVRYVLQAPVDRRLSIRRPAFRQLRYAAFVGGAVGGAAGLVAFRRLPHTPAEWVLSGMLFGGVAILLAYGAAMVAGGLRAKRYVTDLVSVVLLAWAAFDAVSELQTSPFTWIGEVALWPFQFEAIGIAGLVVATAVAVWGLGVINRCSIEAAERRSRLVGQLRFAATMQDIRTVMVIHRQLSQEYIRQRPWARLPQRRKSGVRGKNVAPTVFMRRSLQSFLRWPAFRMLRLVALVALSSACAVGVWAGTGPLVVVAGLALWIAALDLLEPLAQEADHPDRARSMARKLGHTYVSHMFVPYLILLVLVIAGATPLYLRSDPELVGALTPLLMLIPAAAIAGAASAVSSPPGVVTSGIETPEIAGIKALLRVVLPPAIAIVAFLPLVPARNAWNAEHTSAAVTQNMNLAFTVALTVTMWSVLWIRYRDQFKEQMKQQKVPQKDSAK